MVTAVIPTRGDVDVSAIASGLPVSEVIVQASLGGLWGRYIGAWKASHEIVYTQDDDCEVDAQEVIDAYEPGVVVCNMPVAKRAEYPDGIALVGWGAVFDRSLVLRAFSRYRLDIDSLFMRECDRVFTGLSALKLVDVPVRHLPHAHGPGRMGREGRHLADLAEIRERIRLCRLQAA